MSVSRADVQRIAELARLRLEEDEAEAMAHDLDRILAYVETLAELDVEGVPGGVPTVDWPAPERRGDLAPDSLAHPPAEGAPDWRDGFFLVPRLPALDPGVGE